MQDLGGGFCVTSMDLYLLENVLLLIKECLPCQSNSHSGVVSDCELLAKRLGKF